MLEIYKDHNMSYESRSKCRKSYPAAHRSSVGRHAPGACSRAAAARPGESAAMGRYSRPAVCGGEVAAVAQAREIEVKYRIHDVEALLAALKSRGIELGDPMRQDDQAYAPERWSYGDSKLGVPFVRLRTVDDRHTFTLKRPAENALSCVEYESSITDREQMHRAILAMGFYPTVRIAKVRRTAVLTSMSLCLDEVDGLGLFLELERMVPDEVPGEAVQAELAAFAASLDVAAERAEETYDSLVRSALAST